MGGWRRQVAEGVVQGNIHAVLGNLIPAEEESQGDEQTTRGDERNHVGHARHEGLLDALAPANVRSSPLGLLLFIMASGDPMGVWVFGGGDGLRNHLVRLVDGPLHPGLNDWLSGEALPALDTNVGGENDSVSTLDVVGAERLGGGGPLGLDLDVNTQLLPSSPQIVGCHVSVGDAGGTGRNGDDAGRIGGGIGHRGVPRSGEGRCR